MKFPAKVQDSWMSCVNPGCFKHVDCGTHDGGPEIAHEVPVRTNVDIEVEFVRHEPCAHVFDIDVLDVFRLDWVLRHVVVRGTVLARRMKLRLSLVWLVRL